MGVDDKRVMGVWVGVGVGVGGKNLNEQSVAAYIIIECLTRSSARMSGTSDRSTRSFCIPSSSCTIAWYVHWVRRGVAGTLRLYNQIIEYMDHLFDRE